ncbi:MAG: hypothetical protein J0I57_04050 [Hyphomicrobium sp.]|jgi:hypothetical protein|nr:hypothetical protein [Hyphomicrobium sp.]
MSKAKLTKRRALLLAELEYLVGNNCYNGNIQNWGAGGVYEGEGRHFRYPLTVVDGEGQRKKNSYKASPGDPDELMTGYYAFGANRLHIIEALDEVLRYLEGHCGLKLDHSKPPARSE